MNAAALGNLFYREIEKIATAESLSEQEKMDALYRLMGLIFVEATRRERIQFSTLFSRMIYASQTYQLDKKLQLHLQRTLTTSVVHKLSLTLATLKLMMKQVLNKLALKMVSQKQLSVFTLKSGSNYFKIKGSHIGCLFAFICRIMESLDEHQKIIT